MKCVFFLGLTTGMIHFIGDFCTLTIRPIKKICLKVTDYQRVTKGGCLVALFPCFDHRAGAIPSLRACKGYIVRYGGQNTANGTHGVGVCVRQTAGAVYATEKTAKN